MVHCESSCWNCCVVFESVLIKGEFIGDDDDM